MPVLAAPPEATALDIIRTETVLSRLPVHNLAKTGSISIQILKKSETGEIELLWKVSPSRDYGEPRQLAYKLDTIIINQRIDEAGKPLPKILRLGSLNQICEELGIAKLGGKSKNEIKRAFFQNVGALITAKFNYRANDGTERRLEAGFTRYNVIFTGEKLPDGRKADAVYIVFNDPFWEVLNNAPVRPLDRAYMKDLPPAAQRFYEIVSRKIFAALKNNYEYAKISYSEYCTFSAQTRHYERQRAQDQMAKLLRPHKESGYITAVKYEPTIDGENQPDWIMYLAPGPKARAEFAAAYRGRKVQRTIDRDGIGAGDRQTMRYRSRVHRRSKPEPAPPQPAFDPQLVAEFTRRGISEKKTLELLGNLKAGQDAVAQLELGDQLVLNARIPIVNPPGFYIRLIESNTSVPESFETSAKCKAREAREAEERRREDDRREQEELETEYQRYCNEEIERYIATLDPAEVAAVLEAKRQENREKYTTQWMIDSFAQQDTRLELGKRVPIKTFEEWKASREQGTALFPKSVAVPPAAEPAPVIPPAQDAALAGEAASAAGGSAAAVEREAAMPPAPEPATESAIPEPAIELVTEPPRQEPEGDPAGAGMV